MRSAIWAAALFCVVFIIDSLCPVSTSFDSRWTIPVALSLIDRFRIPFDLERIAASDQSDGERVADHAEEGIALAEKLDGFVAAVESDGASFTHQGGPEDRRTIPDANTHCSGPRFMSA